jgi:hypothetical protein
MRIAILVEGGTERVFIPHLRKFLEAHLSGNMPKLVTNVFDGRIPTGPKLRLRVEKLLSDGNDAVIALTDVYTGMNPPIFIDAAEAKRKMSEWVGANERFRPHAAQYEFEAWLLPFWPTILKIAKNDKKSPSNNPETVNHGNPPSHRLQEIFRTGSTGAAYSKVRDAGRILRDQDLRVAVNACSELKSFINTIIKLCGGNALP